MEESRAVAFTKERVDDWYTLVQPLVDGVDRSLIYNMDECGIDIQHIKEGGKVVTVVNVRPHVTRYPDRSHITLVACLCHRRIPRGQIHRLRLPENSVLIMDQHGSRFEPEAIKLQLKHKTQVALLPPHTTHELQPADVSFFGPFKAALDKSCRAEGHSVPQERGWLRLEQLDVWLQEDGHLSLQSGRY